jgi:hypothetical protein
MTSLFVFLILWQVKHFICDYPLQTPYMLGKFKPWPEFIGPLAAHAGVHALGTLCITSPFFAFASTTELWLAVALIDFGSHFLIDRIKASPKLGGRWKPSERYFWWALGADHMAHHLVGIWIAWMMFG